MKRKLRRCFYNRATLKVARELLGKYLVLKKDGKILCFSCLPSPPTWQEISVRSGDLTVT
ncbi:MAG: hypothetical protein MUO85_09210 [candidate division Zixibacteria bacterium]|nr:hypothetical protein [candidate division Zixibacteria bacterium]